MILFWEIDEIYIVDFIILKCGMGYCKILMLVKEYEYCYNVFSCIIFDNKKYFENF